MRKYLPGFICLLMLALSISIYAEEAPRIDIPETIWEVGNIKLDEEAIHVFRIMNAGSEELKISQIRSSCSCLKVELSSDIIQPGRFAEIKGVFREDERLGETIKTIYIDSNDPDSPRSTIRVKAIVLGPQKPETETESPKPIKKQATQDSIVCITFFLSDG